MSEGTWIAYMSIWLVCTVALTVGLIKFMSHARKKHPEEYVRMIERSKRNARWVIRTHLINPTKDAWRDR